MKKRTSIIALSLLSSSVFGQLASRLDQFYLDKGIINPAYINVGNQNRLSLYYNNQFIGLPQSPENMLLNFSVQEPSKNIGFGALLAQERVGFVNTVNAYASYAFTLYRKDNLKIHTAISPGLVTHRINPNAIVSSSSTDPLYLALLNGEPQTKFDFKAGVLMELENLQAGLSFSRIAKNKYTYSTEQGNYSFYNKSLANAFVEGNINIGSDMKLKPVVSVTGFDFANFNYQYGANLYFYDKFWTGIMYQGGKNIAINLGLTLAESYQIGYSYSAPMTNSGGILGSGHEVFAAFVFGKNNAKRNVNPDENGAVATEFVTLSGDSSANTISASDANKKPDDDFVDVSDQNKAALEKTSENSQITENEIDEAAEKIEKSEIPKKKKPVTISKLVDKKEIETYKDTNSYSYNFTSVVDSAIAPGYYLVANVFEIESNADNFLKSLINQGTPAYKFYQKSNNYFYIYIHFTQNLNQAEKVKEEQLKINPELWLKEVNLHLLK